MPNATAVVGLGGSPEAGTVFVLNPKAAELTTLTVGPDGQTLSSKVAKVDGLPDSGKLQLTAVGEQAAVLDPDTGTLFLPGNKKVAVDHGRDGRIQQPSASGNSVAVETSAGLVVQPLGGGAPQLAAITGTGVPIAPVQQGGCIHAAWSGVNQYLHFCAGTQAKPAPIPKAGGQSRLVFRQNRDVVVLNDTNGGDVWLVNQNMMLVNNWDDIQANQNKSNDPNKDSTDPNVVNTLPDRRKRFFCAAMVITNIGNAIDNIFTVQLQHNTESTVCRRMVWSEIQKHKIFGVIFVRAFHSPLFGFE